ncbi:MAG: T9SS type A sorting domain-containing protein [Candidatus Marinimicrobia bacterium]|nr:T9SS type A sorting domain-containing protein [Candidatus Neomarinimicrobiota bacterium]
MVTITDSYGNSVFSDEMVSKQSTIDIETLTAGVYFITIIGNDGSKENHKLIKL